MLRWPAEAVATPALARRELLSGVAGAATKQAPTTAVNLELVTLTEDRAVITWYTGFTGTDDGLGRMVPAPADGVVHWGTHPDRLRRTAGSRHQDTPYHYVELTGLEPGQTYYYEARSDGKRAVPTTFDLIAGNAVGTDDDGVGGGGGGGGAGGGGGGGGGGALRRGPRPGAPRQVGSCSRSRCATTCTWG